MYMNVPYKCEEIALGSVRSSLEEEKKSLPFQICCTQEKKL